LGKKYTIDEKTMLYEFSTGKMVGYIRIPPDEQKCVYNYRGRDIRAPLETYEMSYFAFPCTEWKQDNLYIQGSIYTSTHEYIGDELVYALFYNKTLSFSPKRGPKLSFQTFYGFD
jgi:hypothetical protein